MSSASEDVLLAELSTSEDDVPVQPVCATCPLCHGSGTVLLTSLPDSLAESPDLYSIQTTTDVARLFDGPVSPTPTPLTAPAAGAIPSSSSPSSSPGLRTVSGKPLDPDGLDDEPLMPALEGDSKVTPRSIFQLFLSGLYHGIPASVALITSGLLLRFSKHLLAKWR
ncbi:hypothetical protein H696_01150 [Fonticula alba]|uniref:Uncharacterized protein n=1 Tax=Fonticula alba TaxID=691883 RepID=A0A058ZBF1_FONAL|nr:hypothetical protein H696_01150 [Fonticula alba]KCV71729.1 hypothetical protein H696_01150 [Fonticula alba]|eukprot:XP_009493307.1 hypothetical protein H696_01150 [Fonticula alba]